MSEQAHILERMTVAEFLEWDDGTGVRYELIDGRPVAMAPGTRPHGHLVTSLCGELRQRLQAPCLAYSACGVRVPDAADQFLVPHLVVSCAAQPDDLRWVGDPALVAEVLSPSTQRYDRDQKLSLYRRIPSLRHILLLSPQRRHAIHWQRRSDGWLVVDLVGEATVRLDDLAVAIPLAELYAGIAD